jgi:hypothetical protein
MLGTAAEQLSSELVRMEARSNCCGLSGVLAFTKAFTRPSLRHTETVQRAEGACDGEGKKTAWHNLQLPGWFLVSAAGFCTGVVHALLQSKTAQTVLTVLTVLTGVPAASSVCRRQANCSLLLLRTRKWGRLHRLMPLTALTQQQQQQLKQQSKQRCQARRPSCALKRCNSPAC